MHLPAVFFATAVLTLSAWASAGTINADPGASNPAGASVEPSPPSTIMSGTPVLSSNLPSPYAGQPAAAGTSFNSAATPAADAMSNGTVRMLLSPPPREDDD